MTKIDLKTAGPFIALVALFIIGIFVNDAFLSAGNVSNILARSSFIGIVAIGATFVITTGGIDLSVGSMAAFISGCMILLMNALMSTFDSLITIIFLAIIASAAIGALAGMINGLLTTKAKIEAFIVTLGTMGIYRSLVTYMADGGTLSLNFTIGDVYSEVYYGTLLGLPYPVWVFLAVAIIGYVLLNMTVFGRHCFAVGSNESVAHYSAINVDRVKTATYILQGLCVSIATIIYVPRLGSASGQTGILWELEAIAAVIIGGTMLKGGYGRIWGTVVGALILTLIGNILNLTDAVSNYLNGAVQGVIVIVAVYLQRGAWRAKN
ncbi:MAG: ABC transporter permease [Gammaproteobacteria bacterium]|jgi:ribose transport system permease protein|uniref:ABC transporter permease n=2 Tax=OM182 clade TaxID=745002 RepID=A0A0R2TF42_9GAMM|nr:MAG: ABC transporter permease [OM182 bacterium BACL3 MAG-120920-bin41]MBT3522547.1 ABC transporter permease [Gammaproteobacteria bacterium]MDP4769261.1 ABC transporter permease [OM182 bacterium]MBT4781137.1 ABC transporter permease [Gammaproteobacteria bacterium]MBT6316552.1 ABC transporter permease [Gammaproteobacteria bacterium]|tara:strand:- start:987 stop:1955 length:969 start_codon:yes stop_codon:yes gene_type:complete